MAITRTQLSLLERSHSLSLLRSWPSISLFHFHQNLSTLTEADDAHSHYPNLFAEFASTKFNFSSADIAQMFKSNPYLQRLKTLKKVERFVDLLTRYGCTQHQIAVIMKRRPSCVCFCSEKVMDPKISLLRDLGIRGEDLAKVITSKPSILDTSLHRTLIPNAALLQDVFKTRDLLSKAILRIPSILTYDLEKHLKPSVAFFKECGLDGEQFSRFILSWPRLLLCTSLTPAKADLLQKIGLDKGSKMYKHVLAIVAVSRLETLEAKIDNLQQCGLTLEETMELFRVFPYAFCFSQERVGQNMDFIVKEMGLPANCVIKRQYLLKHNLKVVKPRFLVLRRIHTLNNVGNLDIRGLKSTLVMSEANFVNKIIKGHPESRLLNGFYQETLTDASAITKASTKSSTRSFF